MAILTSIDAIAEINPDVAPTGVDLASAPPTSTPDAPAPAAPPAGDYEPDTIVVLTDGANTAGVDPIIAAEQAAARRVRVYTIGFGTTEPAQLVCTPDQLGGDRPHRRVRPRAARSAADRAAPVGAASWRSTRRRCRASPT